MTGEATALEERADALSRRLDELEASGGARFDRPGCRCVRALMTRAEGLANARLMARAEARLDALEARFERSRADARAAVEELKAAGAPGTGELREALGRGDVSRARRGVRRTRVLAPLDGGAARDPSPAERYRRAAAELSASVTVARARANLPADAGPYNSTLVATHTLDRLAATSPTYLHALVERLEDLAALQSLAPPPEPAPKPSRKRKSSSSGPKRKPSTSKRRSRARR